jgi:molybdopterin-guanine dinucleotide biosynthesis protein A
MSAFDAVILAGGSGERLGGVDKPGITLNGTTLLDRALDAVAHASKIVVVGPERPTAHSVDWTLEHPSGSGPVAALSAGLELTTEDRVVLLASDLPFIDGSTIDALLASAEERDGAIALDVTGRRQPLLAAYSVTALRERLASSHRSMHSLIEGLDLAEIQVGRAADDCDTWEDIEAAREVGRSA